MDSDEEKPVAKKSKVHYGSLAESQFAKDIISNMSKPKSEEGSSKDDVKDESSSSATTSAAPAKEYLPMEPSQTENTREEILAEFERRRKARTLVLPTIDGEVQHMLRSLDQPICIFGEDAPERRERLRLFLSRMSETEREIALSGGAEARAALEAKKAREAAEAETTWYHEGPSSLRDARMAILKYSIPRSKARLDYLRESKNTNASLKTVKLQETQKWARSLSSYCSQFADARPISFCQFSPDSTYLATASWSGLCKLWSVPDCQLIRTYRGHNSHVSSIVFHPHATKSQDPLALNLASCCQDGSVKFWALETEECFGELTGHAPHRVSKVDFHPSGRFVATCCYDNSWRLFDVEHNEEVLFQEGHSKPVHDIAFQGDGSVALTGGLDSYGRVWDLRSGKCIMFLEGHLRGILTVDFASNGYVMATGSQDNSCRVWDLRMRTELYTIPAHKNLVSRVKFNRRPEMYSSCDPEPIFMKDDKPTKKNLAGDYLVTCSYDNMIKVWSHPGWHPLRTLTGHDSKVMCVDVSGNGKWLASSSFDRTFKLWSQDDFAAG